MPEKRLIGLLIGATLLMSSCGQPNTQATSPGVIAEAEAAETGISVQDLLGGTRPLPIKAFYASTVTSFGYGGSLDNARAAWANKSTAAGNISKVTSTDSRTDIYSVASDASVSDFGQTRGYLNGVLDQSTNGNWDHSEVILNDYQIKSYNNGLSVAQNSYRTTMHELGHTFKLAHTSQAAVMNIYPTYYSALQPFDVSELRRSWGN